MSISQSIDEMKVEIERIEGILKSPSTVVCTHVVCDNCKEALKAEKEERDALQVKLNSILELYDKIKQYGTRE